MRPGSGYIGQDGDPKADELFPRIEDHIKIALGSQQGPIRGSEKLIKQYGVGGCFFGYYTEENCFGIGTETWNAFKEVWKVDESDEESQKLNFAEIASVFASNLSERDLASQNVSIGDKGMEFKMPEGFYSKLPKTAQDWLQANKKWNVKMNFADTFNQRDKFLYPLRYGALRAMAFVIATEIFIDPTDSKAPVKESWSKLVAKMIPIIVKNGDVKPEINKWLKNRIEIILTKYADAFSDFDLGGTISVKDFDTEHTALRIANYLEQIVDRSVDDLIHAKNLATGNAFVGQTYFKKVNNKGRTKKVKQTYQAYTKQQLKTLLITRDEFVKMNDGTWANHQGTKLKEPKWLQLAKKNFKLPSTTMLNTPALMEKIKTFCYQDFLNKVSKLQSPSWPYKTSLLDKIKEQYDYYGYNNNFVYLRLRQMENLYIQLSNNPHNIVEYNSSESLISDDKVKVHSNLDIEGQYLYILPRSLWDQFVLDINNTNKLNWNYL